MKYLRRWSVAKYNRQTGLHQSWPDIGLSIWYCKNHSTCFFLCKKISDCKNVWVSSSSESGQEQVLVGVWFRSSAVWDNQIQLISMFLAAGQMRNIKLSYLQLCTTNSHLVVTNSNTRTQEQSCTMPGPWAATQWYSQNSECNTAAVKQQEPAHRISIQRCRAVCGRMLLQPRVCVPVVQWKVLGSAREKEVCAVRLKRLNLQRMRERKWGEKGDPTSCSLIYINQSPFMSHSWDLCSVSL